MIQTNLECPNCGGQLELLKNKIKSICSYCDFVFSVYRIINEKLETVKKSA